MKLFILAFISLHFSCILAADHFYQELLKNEFAAQTQRVTYLYDYTPQSSKEKRTIDFPDYSKEELHRFLTNQFGNFYDGHHSLIDEYIAFFSAQPSVNLRVLFGLFTKIQQESPHLTQGKYSWMHYLYLSRINLMPKEGDKNDYFSVGMNPLIAAHYGIEMTDFVDDRIAFTELFAASTNYLHALEAKFKQPTVQLGALILGAATLRKAILKSDSANSYWELYPFLNHEERDFYPAMLAAAFVWSKRNDWGVKGYEFQPKWNVSKVIATDTVHFNQLTHVLSLEESAFHLFNARYYKKIVPSGQPVIIPMDKQQHFLLLKDSIYNFKRAELLPGSSDSCYVFYRTGRGEYFRDLTYWFGTSLEEIKKLNGFTSNTLPKNWDVFFKVARSDSSFFANFDKMSRDQKDAAARGEKVTKDEPVREQVRDEKPVEKPSGKKITYTVKSGDTLWGIGQKYKVKDADLMKWNNIGTTIQPGQKLIIYLP
jgi:LysM repeat protein